MNNEQNIRTDGKNENKQALSITSITEIQQLLRSEKQKQRWWWRNAKKEKMYKTEAKIEKLHENALFRYFYIKMKGSRIRIDDDEQKPSKCNQQFG